MIEYIRPLVLISGIIGLYAVGYPLEQIHYEGITGNDRAPNSDREIAAVGNDIDNRTDAGESVLVVMPVWLHGSDRQMPMDTPRWYYAADNNHGQELGWDQTSWASRLENGIASGLKTGNISMIIMTPRTHTILARWDAARRAFQDNFCKVLPMPRVYRQWNISVFVHFDNQPTHCSTTTQWPWKMELADKKER